MNWRDKVDRERFIKAMNALQELVPRKKPLTDDGIKLYAYSMGDIDIDELVRACAKASQQCEFFPKPVELRNIALGSVEDMAEIEATKAINAIGAVGTYRSVVFDNPTTQAVIERSFGGWVKFCEMLESERQWRHKEFVKAYKAFAAQGIMHFGVLSGIAAISNGAHCAGAPKEIPAIVGDPEKAKDVMSLSSKNSVEVLINGLSEAKNVKPEAICMNARWNECLDQVEGLIHAEELENKRKK